MQGSGESPQHAFPGPVLEVPSERPFGDPVQHGSGSRMDFNAEQNGSRLVDGLKMHHPSQRMALNRHKDDALWVTLLDPDLDVASNGELRGERASRFDADGRSWFRAEVDRHDIADVLLEVIHQLFRIAPVFAVEFTPESLSSEPSDSARGNKFRTSGVAIVFQEWTIAPLRSGDRADIGETLVALVDYDSSGKFRDELAEKMIWAKLTLAQKGRATGGRPPFGFRRWLVTDNNSPVRQLADGERVRLARHHVLWLPGPKEEFDLILRILAMVEEMPANRVVKDPDGGGGTSPRHESNSPRQRDPSRRSRGLASEYDYWNCPKLAAARNCFVRPQVNGGPTSADSAGPSIHRG